MEPDKNLQMLGEVLTEEQRRRATLIQAFHKIQKEKNYLPEDALQSLSKGLKIPLSEVYSTASFYKQFHFQPRGRHVVSVCVGTACHVRGAQEVVKQLENSFKIKAGETTKDLSLTLETVGCVGCCGIAPVAVVNGKVVGGLTEEKTDHIINNINIDAYKKAE